MRIMSKGQVTIPAHICERADLLPNAEVEFSWDGQVVRLERASQSNKAGRGERVIEHLRGRATLKLGTEDIMALTRSDWCRPPSSRATSFSKP